MLIGLSPRRRKPLAGDRLTTFPAGVAAMEYTVVSMPETKGSKKANLDPTLRIGKDPADRLVQFQIR